MKFMSHGKVVPAQAMWMQFKEGINDVTQDRASAAAHLLLICVGQWRAFRKTQTRKRDREKENNNN